MQSIKTALLIVFMMVILYGAYVILYTPDPPPLQGISDLLEQEVTPPVSPQGEGNPGALAGTEDPVVLTLDSNPIDEPGLETPTDVIGPAPPGEASLVITDDANVASPEDFEPSTGADPGVVAAGVGLQPEDAMEEVLGVDIPSGPEAGTIGEEQAIPTALEADEAFRQAWGVAKQQVEQGDLRAGLLTLSQYHGNNQINLDYQRQLLEILDYLAGEVIYSQKHLVEPPYSVQANDSLEMIAHQYRVPARLLQNINGIQDATLLTPGSELKVVKGPFRARVDLSDKEITLFVGQLYAGRFACQVGADPYPEPGQYTVLAKQQGRSYYVGDGSVIPGGDPRNPYGHIWLDLGNQVCLHASAQSEEVATSQLGCIRMNQADSSNVYGILSAGSQVLIRR
ncbi:MAG: LysM peptidoglycan-binding domain-containing protein [Pirellulaceae bacterium]